MGLKSYLIVFSVGFSLFLASGCGKAKLLNEQNQLNGRASTPAGNIAIEDSTLGVVPPIPGSAIISGGGVSTGQGMKVNSSVGEAVGGKIQRSQSVVLVPGVQGAVSTY